MALGPGCVRVLLLWTLVWTGAQAAPSPLLLLRQEEVGTSFQLQAARFTLDGAELLALEGDAARGPWPKRTVTPGVHTLVVELLYTGHSKLFNYLDGYRFRLRTRATLKLEEGEGLELTTAVTAARHATQGWQESLQWHLTGTPRRALLDVENLPVRRENPDGSSADGLPEVSAQEQARDDARAEQLVRQVLEQADRRARAAGAAGPSNPAPACAAGAVHFALAQFRVPAGAREALLELSGCLANTPAARVRVEGHCDVRGSAAYNDELARWRAESVVRFLLAHGAAGYQLQAVGYGSRRPLCAALAEGCYARNRRVQFTAGLPDAGEARDEAPSGGPPTLSGPLRAQERAEGPASGLGRP